MPASPARGIERLLRRNLAAGQKGLSVAFISPPTAATTPIIRASPATSAWRRRDRFDLRHAPRCSTASPRRDVGVDDHERAVLPVLALYMSPPRSGRRARQARGHDPERHPQGIMVRNTYIYPPGASLKIISDIFAYPPRAHAEVQLDLDSATTAGGGRDRRPRARLPARRRRRIRCARARRRACDRHLCAAAVRFRKRRHEFSWRWRSSAPRAFCGRSRKTFEPKSEARAGAALANPDSGWSLA